MHIKVHGIELSRQVCSIELSRTLYGFLWGNISIQVVTEMEPSREGEVEAIVGFLSRKLAATKSAVRSRARRCFAGLFSPSLQTSETPAASHPSSPRDSKRPDNIPGGLGRWPGGSSSSTDTAVPVHTRKSAGTTTTSYSSTHLSPGVSPGVNHTVIHTDNHRDRMRAGYPSAGTEDDTSWLHLVEKLPTGPRLISAVLPAVWLALQQETSIRVVSLSHHTELGIEIVYISWGSTLSSVCTIGS